MAAEQADTIVGAQVELKGSLRNSGPIHIYGKVIGDITSDSLVVIGESAMVQGPIVESKLISPDRFKVQLPPVVFWNYKLNLE